MSRTKHHGYKAKSRNNLEDNIYGNEPKLWRKFKKHKPKRTEEKTLEVKVLRGDEDVLWPLDKKPWIYYW